MSKKNTDQWFEAYGVCHQNPTNKLIHWICIPLIMLSLLGLLWEIPVPTFIQAVVPSFHWTHAVIVACLLFYLWLSPVLAVGMAISSAICLLIIQSYEVSNLGSVGSASLVIFVAAWIGQFIGHKVEGKKPAFFEDLQFLLIGPIWLLGALYRRVGINY